jgi:hypothetical protein
MIVMAGSIGPSSGVGALVQRKSLIGFRTACEQMWGPTGYAAICALLPPAVSDRTAGMRPLPDWVALEDLIAWHVAVWNGPAKRDEKIMTEHIHLTVDQGFGRVKRALLSMSTPQSLAPRVVSLWHEEYSTGRLVASNVEPRSVQLTLSDHPYVEDPLMRFVISEVFRYVVSKTQVRNVTVVHAARDGRLVVVLRWT